MFNSKALVRSWGVVAFLGLACASVSVSASTDDEIREAIQDALVQRHPKDSADFWRRLGPAAPKVMISMYSATTNTYHRIRLVEALAWFPEDAQAADFLRTVAQENFDKDAQDGVLRNTAVRAIGRSQGEKELGFLSKFLKHPDSQTRLAAAQAVSGMSGEAAKKELEKYRKEEKAEWILSRIDGQPQKPSRGLVAVSSSEDRVDPRFEGTWSGFWIFPRPGSGLEAEGVSVKFRILAPTELAGDLTRMTKLQPAPGERPLQTAFVRLKAKGAHVTGGLPDTILPPALPGAKKATAPESFDGEIGDEGGSLQLRLPMPRSGSILILRKHGA